LPIQIEACPNLQPSPDSPRNTPIAGVVLTNADLDHVLGLFALREGGPLSIHAPTAVRQTLDRSLGLDAVLNTFCGATWHEPPVGHYGPIALADGTSARLTYRGIELPGKPPPFAREQATAGTQSIACQFRDPDSGRRLVVAPDIGFVTQDLLEALEEADAVLFDGTFWSSAELSRAKPNAPQAAEMGHVTIEDCSLELLGKLAARTKIFIHINNTNPILAVDSPERKAVEAAGIVVGSDGLEFEL
jgi:pyrroloquinoline quinone biosynthesis protein B